MHWCKVFIPVFTLIGCLFFKDAASVILSADASFIMMESSEEESSEKNETSEKLEWDEAKLHASRSRFIHLKLAAAALAAVREGKINSIGFDILSPPPDGR